MAKLAQIIGPFSKTIGEPEESVRVLAAHLRKVGLITKAGRGPAGAEMGPSDATNLLLSVLVGGQSKEAAERVSFMRAAKVRQVTPSPKLEESEHQSIPFSVADGEEYLGATLDKMFEQLIDYSLVNSVTNLPLTNYSLQVNEPNIWGGSADLWLDDGNLSVYIQFHRNGLAFEGKPRNKWDRIARELRRAHPSDGIERKAIVGTDTLNAIANCFQSNTTGRAARPAASGEPASGRQQL